MQEKSKDMPDVLLTKGGGMKIDMIKCDLKNG